MTLLDYRTIEFDKIQHKNPRKDKSKYIGKVLYDDRMIEIKTPFIRCLSEIIISQNRCYIECELDMEDKDLYEFLTDLDELNIRVAYKNSKHWFGDDVPLDIIDDFYIPCTRLHNHLKRPYIKIKMPYDTEKNKFPKKINEQDFKVGNLISAKIQYNGLIFYKERFTSEWTLVDYEVEHQYQFINMMNGSNKDDIEPESEPETEKLETETETEEPVEPVKPETELPTKKIVRFMDESNSAKPSRVDENIEFPDVAQVSALKKSCETASFETNSEELNTNKTESLEKIDKIKETSSVEKNLRKKKKVLKYANKKRIWQ